MSTDASGADLRLDYTAEELLSDGDFSEPLIANGVLCHGGFDADGHYNSPRTLHRAPAIRAWQARLEADGAPLIDIPRELMPPQYPNLDQSVLLLEEGVRDPIVRTLTTISIVEGFGAIIRDVAVPDLDALVVEPIEGTALAHLKRGLFEAHARDEAGHRDQGGHKQMWEAARDLALENPKIPQRRADADDGSRAGGRRRREARPSPSSTRSWSACSATMAQVLAVEVFADGRLRLGQEPARQSGGVGCTRSRRPHGVPTSSATSRRTWSTCAPRSPRCGRARCAPSTAARSPGARWCDGMLHRTLSRPDPRAARGAARRHPARARRGHAASRGNPAAVREKLRRAREPVDVRPSEDRLRARGRGNRTRGSMKLLRPRLLAQPADRRPHAGIYLWCIYKMPPRTRAAGGACPSPRGLDPTHEKGARAILKCAPPSTCAASSSSSARASRPGPTSSRRPTSRS